MDSPHAPKQHRCPDPPTGAGPPSPPAPAPPLAREVAETCGVNYAAAYRWTHGLSRFPLDAFIKVIRARGADLPTALAWADHWLSAAAPDPDPDLPPADPPAPLAADPTGDC